MGYLVLPLVSILGGNLNITLAVNPSSMSNDFRSIVGTSFSLIKACTSSLVLQDSFSWPSLVYIDTYMQHNTFLIIKSLNKVFDFSQISSRALKRFVSSRIYCFSNFCLLLWFVQLIFTYSSLVANSLSFLFLQKLF